MIVYFGLAFDEYVFPQTSFLGSGVRILGPNGMLRLFEALCGLQGHEDNNAHLRIEQYRQALLNCLEQQPDAFYQHALLADPFAAAEDLLARRDELLLAGWNFVQTADCPIRLQQIAFVEQYLQEGELSLSPGFADRFKAVIDTLPKRSLQSISQIRIHEGQGYLPGHFARLFNLVALSGISVNYLEETQGEAPEHTDLGAFQRLLSGHSHKCTLKADGSLLVLRGARETDLAAYMAALIRHNPLFRPLVLIPGQRRTFDDALIQEGLPSMGIMASSLARPTMQILKLVTAFLWQPVDPYKIMEFVTLPVKPLEEELSRRVATQLAATPGIQSESWYAMIRHYFDERNASLTDHAKAGKVDAARQQYNFWFERNRYSRTAGAPKTDAIELFDYLEKWAWNTYDENAGRHPSLLVLHQQARRIRELLEAFPEEKLSPLALERIVRTIYEAAPAQLYEVEQDALPGIFHPAALYGSVGQLMWWNFTQTEAVHFFSRWYIPERNWLKTLGVELVLPAQENALMIWQRLRPFLWAKERVVLVLPDSVDGTTVSPHPLWGDLEAAFGHLSAITLNPNSGDTPSEVWSSAFALPNTGQLPVRQLGRPQPFLKIEALANRLSQRTAETFTSLETLLYYPYQWVFRHQVKLSKSAILSVVPDNRLMGNLAHRFFELLLKEEDIVEWTKEQLEKWIDEESYRLFLREGVVLLMYGREPERQAFLNRVKYAAWSLVNLIKQGKWRIAHTEKPLEGHMMGMSMAGRADLVLEREEELAIVDLKWSGFSRRRELIRNEEDLQLILYAFLLGEPGKLVHTAYFIMENGKMVARNAAAFADAVAVSPGTDHTQVYERILAKLEATYRWRQQQLNQGLVEVRCEQTRQTLEEHYGAELMDLLEMKTEDAYFDDYRTLINLLE